MFTLRTANLWSPKFRRVVVGVSLAAYLASVWGYPLPVVASTAPTAPEAASHPCQQHACGCHTAAQCWQDCCCFTPAERLAWAKKHEVAIPAEARAALAAACHTPPVRSCCAQSTAAPANPPRHHACSLDEAPVELVWVLGVEARKCRGLATLWVAAGAVLPLEISPGWQFEWSCTGHVTNKTDCLQSIVLSPPEHPPRIAA